MNLDASIIDALIPIVSVVATLGMPVAIIFVVKYFNLRNRELDAEIAARKAWSEKERAIFEARLDRIESALFARSAAPLAAPLHAQLPAPLPDRSLMEGPPESSGAPGAQAARRDPLAQK